MVDSPGPLFRILGGLFERVQFPEEEVERLLDAHRDGNVVYVLRGESLLDYLFFNWAFLRRGLPLAIYGQAMSMWPWRTMASAARRLWRFLSGRRRDEQAFVQAAVKEGAPVLLFLEPARSIWPWARRKREDRMDAVIRAAQESDRPCLVVPLLMVWDRAPNTV